MVVAAAYVRRGVTRARGTGQLSACRNFDRTGRFTRGRGILHHPLSMTGELPVRVKYKRSGDDGKVESNFAKSLRASRCCTKPGWRVGLCPAVDVRSR